MDGSLGQILTMLLEADFQKILMFKILKGGLVDMTSAWQSCQGDYKPDSLFTRDNMTVIARNIKEVEDGINGKTDHPRGLVLILLK